MTEAARRLTLPNQPGAELRARGFAEALTAARGKHVLIALRGHPDPDGIACAIAQAHIAQRLGVAQTTVAYCHELSHRENRALVKLLGLDLRKIKSVRELGKVDFIALVDAHEVDPDLADAGDYEVITVVDHHRPASPPKARFVDMRMDVGATATIFVEYLLELAVLDPDVEEDRRIATALMHGLSTDTDDFMLARSTDFRAAGQIAEICDRDLLQDLSRRLIAPTAMDVIARALQALGVRRNFAMAGVGFVTEAERDTIAQAADFLVRREDIDTCVVYGVVGDKYIEGSLRTHSPSVDPPVWLEQAFGTDEKGRPYGRVTDRAQLWQLVEHAVRTALLRQSGEDPTPGVLVPPVAPT
jgi:nanoRNase/pAp phosphatase (c-di-AMP/oligoRNAs hydrolase)